MSTALFLSAPYIDPQISKYCYMRLIDTADKVGLEVVKTHQPEDWPRSHISLYKNLLCGLSLVNTSHVFICEHDCIYPDEYFSEDSTEKRFSYSANMEYLTRYGFVMRTMKRTGTMSTLYGNTTAIITAVSDKLHDAETGRVKWTEPGDARPLRRAKRIIDIRHEKNFTGSRHGMVYDYERAQNLWREIDG